MDKSSTAHLETLSFAKLASKDSDELTKLFHACQQQGFFYLDLAGSSAAQGLDTRLKALSATTDWFDRPMEEKMECYASSGTKGYKPPGRLTGVYKGKKDGFEDIKMPRDNFINGTENLPRGLAANIDLFRSDLDFSHTVITTVLSCLSDLLKPKVRFENYHRAKEASKYITKPPTAGVTGYVMPIPGLYVVNAGDALRFFSENRLLGALHRVVPVPGHETEYRYSTAYFLRPEDKAIYQTSENTSVQDWHDSKYEVFKADHEEQKNTILTGGIKVQG